METARELAPPVVAVMVVHHPGSWFEQVLDGVARQDYPDLQTLVLLVSDGSEADSTVADRIRERLPNAFINPVAANPGFGPAANEVLGLVEGDNGFFCFLHDDVALDPAAIRLLVEELYRSNAGIVGPKLLDWDEPRLLQHVGFGVDRFGEIDPIVERGEVDQEQHDAVRDVFALPSACMLVRADLFRTLDGFDTSMPFHGEDLDLCWRAHRSGARVVVVPAARARHLEALVERRPDLAHDTLRARHRLRSVLSLGAARRLPLLLVELTLVTVVELVVGLFTGRVRSGIAGLRALVGAIPRSFGIVGRRRALAASRHVPDREVVALQVKGSARFAAFLRSRDVRTDRPASQRTWRERAGGASVITWIGVLVALALGSRHLITDGVPTFGEFLSFDDSPRRMLRGYLTDWSGHGVGGARPVPTGVALIGLSSIATVFRMGLLHTVGVVGLLVVGCLGIWRISSAFSTNRGRIVTLVVYAAVPLPGQMISFGRWGALACYAALPWLVDAMRRFAGIEPGRPDAERERLVPLSSRRRIQIAAGASLGAAVAIAFEPSFWFLLLLVAGVLAIATLASGVHWLAAVNVAVVGVVATAVGLALNLPWIGSLIGDGGWQATVGPPTPGGGGNRVLDLASFDVGNLRGVILSLALYLPVIAAPLLGRGWRYAWAVRGGALVAGFLWLAVLADRDSLPIRMPQPGILLVPVAIGVAIAAGCVVASFELDVRGGSFGWRQPLGLIGSLAVGVGILPGLFALSTGRWETPTATLVDALGQLPDDPADGDYRVLWIGDQRIVPAAGQSYRTGITYALTDNDTLRIDEIWATRPETADARIVEALDAIGTGSTARAGRLLAPFAVRYIVIPAADGAASPADDPLPLPLGLLDALDDQLDLGELYTTRANFVIYENRAWLPMRSMLTAAGAEASRLAGSDALAQADVSGATPVMIGADELIAGRARLPAGTLHVAEPFDRGWQLTVDGVDVPGRPAFGSTIAYDVARGGQARLRYERSPNWSWLLAAQGLAWVAVAVAALNVHVPRLRRPGRRGRAVEPLLVLQSPVIAGPPFAVVAGADVAPAVDLPPGTVSTVDAPVIRVTPLDVPTMDVASDVRAVDVPTGELDVVELDVTAPPEPGS